MCNGTYILSYTCGHVLTTPNTCLRAIDPHYRCEPHGMKITKPVGRCVECFARDLEPSARLATSVRFNPFPVVGHDDDDESGEVGRGRNNPFGGGGGGGGGGGAGQVRAILRWVGNVRSLKSLGSRSLGELRGENWYRRNSSESSSSSVVGSGRILVRRSFEVDSVRLAEEGKEDDDD